jgi:hypothetical protein
VIADAELIKREMAGASEGVYESYADSRQTAIRDAVTKENPCRLRRHKG